MDNCKNCEYLIFYDWYICLNTLDGIVDVEKETCCDFKKRESRFWQQEGGEF